VALAQTAERAKFDFFFLAEGLRMREHAGRLHELDVAGRPDSLTVLSAVAAVTDRLGLMATITTTYHEPYELARQLASLDHLSGGRAGWNLVTSSDPFTGANFRRGGYLPYERRYDRGGQFVQAAQALWSSWDHGARGAASGNGGSARAGRFDFHDSQVDIAGEFSVPRSPQGRPVMIQAGDSDDGREFAARYADGIFTRHGKLEAGLSFYADVKRRLARYGRTPDELLILPGASFILGDTDDEALEIAREVSRLQVSGPHAIMFLEQLWNRDLSAYDPDGPLPDIDPDVDTEARAQGSAGARTLRQTAPGDRRPVARTGAGPQPLDSRAGDRDDGPPDVRGLAADRRRLSERLRPGRGLRRVHPDPAHHPVRAGPVRRRGGPVAAGAGHVPQRVRGHDAARPSRPAPAPDRHRPGRGRRVVQIAVR
jgi:FMN-dependent oxidoreductase (nitrilotriacetate monooxygenase family)